jgi:hypothetical protein
MGKILVKNSFTAASVPAGLSAGELAVNVIDKKLFVGNAVGGVVTLIDPNALVTSFNGLTGAVTGITAGGANTFTQLNTFSAGISASSGIFGNTGIRVGENVSRFLTITSDGNNNAITQNGNSTLSINHSNNGSIYIGDSDVQNNGTYIDVNDDATTIILHGEVSGTSTTASTSSTTGALIVAGGVGIAKDSYINGHRIGQGLLATQTNLAVGTSTLNSTIAGGINNTALGYVAGSNITTGANNVMLGSNAGFSNTTGIGNLCIGNGSHYKNTTGSYNVAIGDGAGHEINSASVYNTFIGTYSGYYLTSGSNLVCIGGQAGFYQANGVTALTASSNSVYIGYNAKGFNNSDSNSIVIGSGAIGLGANTTVIGTSSTTAATIYGTLNLPSGLSAAGATFNGTVNIGTTALISAPSATALAIKSQIPAGTGVTPTIQVICPSSEYLLTNQTATQKVFNLPQDTITLQAATTYMFEGHYLLTTGTTSHTTSMSFVLTTATITNCTWTTFTTMPSALNTVAAGNATAIFNSVTGGVVNGGSTNPNTMITFKGIMRVNAGGTMVPNIAFSAQPGGTNNVLIGSYLKFYPIGSNTIDFVGTAIG